MTDPLAALDALEKPKVGATRWEPAPALAAKILAKHAEGFSVNAIAEAIGKSPATVMRWVRDQDDDPNRTS